MKSLMSGGMEIALVVVLHFCAGARTDGEHLAEMMNKADMILGGNVPVKLVPLRYGDDSIPLAIPDPTRAESTTDKPLVAQFPKSAEWFRDVTQVWLKTQDELSDKDTKLEKLTEKVC
jgi:hypothetical protein